MSSSPKVPGGGDSAAIESTEYNNAQAAEKSPSVATAAHALMVNHDRWRFWLGVGAFLGAIALGVWLLCWLTKAISELAGLPQPGFIFLSKAVITIAMGGFGLALLRLSDRLTMPTSELVKLEAARYKQEGSADDVLGLDRAARLVELVKTVGSGQ